MATTPKIKFDYDAKIEDFKRAWTDAEKKIAQAGTAAIREVGDLAVTRGRAQLGARGFKDGYFPWQKAFEGRDVSAQRQGLAARRGSRRPQQSASSACSSSAPSPSRGRSRICGCR